jgi:hypothetical protein
MNGSNGSDIEHVPINIDAEQLWTSWKTQPAQKTAQNAKSHTLKATGNDGKIFKKHDPKLSISKPKVEEKKSKIKPPSIH